MKKKKKFHVSFLTDKNNSWFNEYIVKLKVNLPKKYKYFFSSNSKKIVEQDIVFIINYTKILPAKFLDKNKLNLVIHSSNLPENKGFSPLNYQVLRGNNIIDTCIIEANEKVDSGNIFLKKKIKLNGTELAKELREKQAHTMISMIISFLKKYPNIKSNDQSGKSTFNKKRTKLNSKININKSIKSQFNLLRICDNERYPIFFNYKKKKFILKIYKGD